MTDSVKTIRESINNRIETATGFKELENKFDLEKNNRTNLIERYGVIALDGVSADTEYQGYISISRDFQITLCNKFVSTMNKDNSQEAVGDKLENAMESIVDDLETTNAGVSSLVTITRYSSNDAIVYDEIENLAILRFVMNIQYKKFLGCSNR